LCIRARLTASFPELKTAIFIEPGKHMQETDLNKQLNDKERVAAALENPPIREVVMRLIEIRERTYD
jgi:hypothetical protein